MNKKFTCVFLTAFIATIFISCSNEDFCETLSDEVLYEMSIMDTENSEGKELAIIQNAYENCLSEKFGRFVRKGDPEECDKKVTLECKDAELELSDIEIDGNYTVLVKRVSDNDDKTVYTKSYSAVSKSRKIKMRTSWEQGRYTSTGAKASSNTVIRTATPIVITTGEQYEFERETGTTVLVFYYNKEGALINYITLSNSNTITVPANAVYMHISYRSTSTIDVSFADTFTLYQVVKRSDYMDKLAATPMLTIIDDDSHTRYYTDIYPVASAKKVSISSAVIAGQVGNLSTRMSWENVNEVYCGGMEMLCHTYTHPLTTDPGWSSYNEIYFENDYRKARNTLKAHGIDVNLLVFSGSSARYDMCQEACKRCNFDGGFLAGDNKITYGDTDRYKIPRFRIGNDSDYHYDLPLLKAIVDKLAASGGWMVWMVHTSSSKGWVPGTGEGSSAYMLGEIVDYARANQVSVVTAEYGFRKCYLEN